MVHTVVATLLLLFFQNPKGSVDGTVLSSTTNKPIAGAQITAVRSQLSPGLSPAISSELIAGTVARSNPATTLRVSADDNGYFVFRDLEPGTYILNASADGYAKQQIGASAYGKTQIMAPATVTAGQTTHNIVFRLMPAGVVSGRVTGANGEPLVGLEVMLIHPNYSIGGRRNVSQMATAQTNDKGEYRAFWIMPGQYYISVSPSFRPRAGVNSLVPSVRNNRYSRTFYPGVPTMDAATQIAVTPGSELSAMDFRLLPQSPHAIRGRIVDSATGGFPRYASISIVPREQSVGVITSWSGQYDSTTGAFELSDVLSGSYWIRAQMQTRPSIDPSGRAPSLPSATAAVDVVGGDVDNVVLSVTPSVSVSGRLRIEGSPSSVRPLSVALEPLRSGRLMGPSPLPALVQPDGTFRIGSVDPGDYQLVVPQLSAYGPTPPDADTNTNALFVKEAWLGSTDLLTKPLIIAGPVQGDIQILVSATAGHITGVVKDENQRPAPGLQVVLVPDNRERRDRYRLGMTGATGQFTVQPVAPGGYKIFAVEDWVMSSFFDPTVLKKLDPQGVPVTVGESSHVTLELKVVRLP